MDQRSGLWGPIGAVTGLAALIVATIALASRGASVPAAAAGTAAHHGDTTAIAEVAVELGDIFIRPETLTVTPGHVVLAVHNGGAIGHTLGRSGTARVTPLLAGGASARLDLGTLKAGTYKLHCTVPGHAAGGMTAALVVTRKAAAVSTAAAMDAAMARRTKAFPAKTAGTGARVLAPVIDADGAKHFEITASVTRWEVEPGKTVEAWAYNGQVPGPTIKVRSGDRVRVVLHNALHESTSIHFHGIRVPNAMDGVPDITQSPVPPGATFTYEFVARGPAVGMYHSHHNAATQVPNGLLGTFLIDDLPVPPGVRVAQEVPMVLNDSGVIGLSINGKSFPATAPVAAPPGSWVLVHYLNEGVLMHPMHLHGLVQRVIAKDGTPLAQPYDADTVAVAPGERYSVLVHADEPGVWAWHCHILTHAEREDGMFGMVTAMVVQ